MTTWTVVFEHGPTSWGAYVPALPGLGVAGETRAEVEQLIREAIPFHLDGLAADGLPTPDPESVETAAVSVRRSEFGADPLAAAPVTERWVGWSDARFPRNQLTPHRVPIRLRP